MKAEGWAVFDDDAINVRSVSNTRRAAIINFLVTERNARILTSHTDNFIEGVWQKLKHEARVIEVTVEESKRG